MPHPLYPWGKRPCYLLDRRMVGPTAGLGEVAERMKFLALLGIKACFSRLV